MMLSGNNLIAVHGFLGLPADWRQLPLTQNARCVDLWSVVENSNDFLGWLNPQPSTLASKPVLLGYSLGGRLAMHEVLSHPAEYRAAVIVSAHPGLENEGERQARLESDLRWAERFCRDDWGSLLADWNQQKVFASPNAGVSLHRHELDFNRLQLADALNRWSLARQRNLRKELSALQLPVLFVTGEADGKFTQLIRSLQLNEHQAHVVVPGAGHRVPWDQPLAFSQAVGHWLNSI